VYLIVLNIPLTAEELAWLQGKVGSGQFNSIEEAAVAAINDIMVSEADDMSWARPWSTRHGLP
jgi:hypothetical protein